MDVIPKAKSAALKALELDDTLAESHISMGSVLLWHDWDWPAAGRELKRAIELNPNNSQAHLQYCGYLIIEGRFEEALAQARKALELDPLSVLTNTEVANRLHLLGRYDEAIEQYKKVLEWQPDSSSAYFHLTRIYYKKGMYDESVEALKKRWMLSGEEEIAEAVGNAYASSGYAGAFMESARQASSLSQRQYFSPVLIAMNYATANEVDKAIQWLETGYEQRDPLMIGLLDFRRHLLGSDPRFQDLLRRMNFPK
jgi:tetratricopeptide (TPR) repeat protein